jgi:hypothetical protein
MYATEVKLMFFMINTLIGLGAGQNGAEFYSYERTNMKQFDPTDAPNELTCRRDPRAVSRLESTGVQPCLT